MKLALWDGEDNMLWWPDDGSVRQGTPVDLAATRDGAALVVALASPALTLHQRAAPPLRGERARRALANALEDDLAQDLDEVEISVGTRSAEGEVLLAVGADAAVAEWRARLAAAALPVRALVPAAALLAPGQALSWRNLAVLRDHAGGACLESAAAGALPHAGMALRWCPVERADTLDVARLPLAPNLLARTVASGRRLRPYRPALALALIAALIWVAGSGHALWRLERERAALDAALDERFSELLPGTVPGSDPVAQIAAALRAGASSVDSPLPLLARAAPAFEDLQLSGVRYDGSRLRVRAELADLGALEALCARLAEAGLHVEVLSATAEGKRVPVELELGATP